MAASFAVSRSPGYEWRHAAAWLNVFGRATVRSSSDFDDWTACSFDDGHGKVAASVSLYEIAAAGESPSIVIPANAAIHSLGALDSRVRGNDGVGGFFADMVSVKATAA